MKLRFYLCALAVAFPAFLQAQTVSYSLPQTTVTVEVDAVHESFFAGPYAPFAKKYLGLDVRQSDAVNVEIRQIRLLTRVEGDPGKRYSVDAKAAEERFLSLSSQGLVSFRDQTEADALTWRFDPEPDPGFDVKGLASPTRKEVQTVWRNVQTDTAVTRIQVQESIQVENTPEMRAKEAAEMVLKARRERFNISTGNTDATFSGEALGAALAELDRIEKDYLSLFTGYTVSRKLNGSFDVVPQALARKQQYVAFRLSGKDGLTADGVSEGTPYYLDFEPVEVSDPENVSSKDNRSVIHYRIPAVCKVRLSGGGRSYLQARVPVYQLGVECTASLK